VKHVLGTGLIPLRTKLATQTKRVPAWPVINQLCFPERHFSANGISLRLNEVQMRFYERSMQALLSSAPRGFAARSRILARLASLAQIRRACFAACSRVLARLASLAQIGELARRLKHSVLMTCHYPDLGGSFVRLKQFPTWHG